MDCTVFDILFVSNLHAMETSTISKKLVYWIDKLVDVYGIMHWCVSWCVSRHIGWRLLMHWRVGWYADSTSWLKMHQHVGWCVRLTCWLTFTNALTCWLVCWINMLVDYHWYIDVLVGMLNRHVGWLSLMHWRVGWYVESTGWFNITDALTCWLVYWINMFAHYHWYIDMFIGVLDRHAVCTALLNAIVADRLLPFVIKENKKNNYMFNTFSKLVENLHSAVAVRWNVKRSIM